MHTLLCGMSIALRSEWSCSGVVPIKSSLDTPCPMMKWHHCVTYIVPYNQIVTKNVHHMFSRHYGGTLHQISILWVHTTRMKALCMYVSICNNYYCFTVRYNIHLTLPSMFLSAQVLTAMPYGYYLQITPVWLQDSCCGLWWGIVKYVLSESDVRKCTKSIWVNILQLCTCTHVHIHTVHTYTSMACLNTIE